MTTIGSTGSNNPLALALKAQGLSGDTIKLVEGDLQAVEESTAAPTSKQAPKVDNATVRAALDDKLKADVASGKITQEDADKVNEALDKMDADATNAVSAGGAAAGAAKAGGAGANGGGGGSGESEKTEMSRSVTVSNGIKTTVITYTDGTSETETSVDLSDEDTSKNKVDDGDDRSKSGDTVKAKPEEKSDPSVSDAYGSPGKDTVQDYLSKIEPGTLFEIHA